MSSSEGRGKTAFRAFLRTLTEIEQYVKGAVKGGEWYSRSEIFEQMDLEYQNFKFDFDNTDLPNADYWLPKAEKEIILRSTRLADKLGIRSDDPDDLEPLENPEEAEDATLEGQDVIGYLLGHPVVSPAFRRYMQIAGYSMRKRILINLTELQKYLADLPEEYVAALEEVRSGERVIGYRVWMA